MFGKWLGRAYLNLDQSFFEGCKHFDLEKILDEIAECVRIHNGQRLYYYIKAPNGQTIKKTCLRKTKAYILSEANIFINQFKEEPADENAVSRISMTQFNRLIRAIWEKHGRISCYSLIILHICHAIIINNGGNMYIHQANLTNIANLLHLVSERYYLGNPDPLARFLIRCHEPFMKELQQKFICEMGDFPRVPKRNPQNK